MKMEPCTRQNSTTQQLNLTESLYSSMDNLTLTVHMFNRDHLTLRPSTVDCELESSQLALLRGEVCIETQDHMHCQN